MDCRGRATCCTDSYNPLYAYLQSASVPAFAWSVRGSFPAMVGGLQDAARAAPLVADFHQQTASTKKLCAPRLPPPRSRSGRALPEPVFQRATFHPPIVYRHHAPIEHSADYSFQRQHRYEIWRKKEVSIPSRSRDPSVFKAAPTPRPVPLPLLRQIGWRGWNRTTSICFQRAAFYH